MAKIPYPDSTDHNVELSHWYILCDVSDILQSAHLIILPEQGLDKSASKARPLELMKKVSLTQILECSFY